LRFAEFKIRIAHGSASRFRIKAIYPNAIDAARKIKPQIPELGEHGIPIRDEIEMEMTLMR